MRHSVALRAFPTPIGFWKYPSAEESKNDRWIDQDLVTGTTPTTRQSNILFNNFKHPIAKTADFGGDAAWTDTKYKIVVFNKKNGSSIELYDLQLDPKEENDLASKHPEIVKTMKAQLETWQQSVERSLSGADY